LQLACHFKSTDSTSSTQQVRLLLSPRSKRNSHELLQEARQPVVSPRAVPSLPNSVKATSIPKKASLCAQYVDGQQFVPHDAPYPSVRYRSVLEDQSVRLIQKCSISPRTSKLTTRALVTGNSATPNSRAGSHSRLG